MPTATQPSRRRSRLAGALLITVIAAGCGGASVHVATPSAPVGGGGATTTAIVTSEQPAVGVGICVENDSLAQLVPEAASAVQTFVDGLTTGLADTATHPAVDLVVRTMGPHSFDRPPLAQGLIPSEPAIPARAGDSATDDQAAAVVQARARAEQTRANAVAVAQDIATQVTKAKPGKPDGGLDLVGCAGAVDTRFDAEDVPSRYVVFIGRNAVDKTEQDTGSAKDFPDFLRDTHGIFVLACRSEGECDSVKGSLLWFHLITGMAGPPRWYAAESVSNALDPVLKALHS